MWHGLNGLERARQRRLQLKTILHAPTNQPIIPLSIYTAPQSIPDRAPSGSSRIKINGDSRARQSCAWGPGCHGRHPLGQRRQRHPPAARRRRPARPRPWRLPGGGRCKCVCVCMYVYAGSVRACSVGRVPFFFFSRPGQGAGRDGHSADTHRMHIYTYIFRCCRRAGNRSRPRWRAAGSQVRRDGDGSIGAYVCVDVYIWAWAYIYVHTFQPTHIHIHTPPLGCLLTFSTPLSPTNTSIHIHTQPFRLPAQVQHAGAAGRRGAALLGLVPHALRRTYLNFYMYICRWEGACTCVCMYVHIHVSAYAWLVVCTHHPTQIPPKSTNHKQVLLGVLIAIGIFCVFGSCLSVRPVSINICTYTYTCIPSPN